MEYINNGDNQGYQDAQQPTGFYQPDQPAPVGKGLGIAAMVLGIVAIVFTFINPWIALPAAIVSVVLAAIQMKKGKSGMAIAGLVLGIVSLAITLIAVACAISLLCAAGDLINNMLYY